MRLPEPSTRRRPKFQGRSAQSEAAGDFLRSPPRLGWAILLYPFSRNYPIKVSLGTIDTGKYNPTFARASIFAVRIPCTLKSGLLHAIFFMADRVCEYDDTKR